MIRPLVSPHHRPTTPMPSAEAEHVAERQADEPVAGEVPDHGRPRIAEPAQRAGGDRLHAVEQLEDCGDHQQRHADLEDAADRAVNAPMSAARQQQERRRPSTP